MKKAIRSRKTSVSTFAVADTETYHIRCMARDGVDVRLVKDGVDKGSPMIFKNGRELPPMLIWENGVDEAVMLHRYEGGEPDRVPYTYIRCLALAVGDCQGETVTSEWTGRDVCEWFGAVVDKVPGSIKRVYFHNLKFDMEMIWAWMEANAEERKDHYILKVRDGLRIKANKDCMRLVHGQMYSVDMQIMVPKIVDGRNKGWVGSGKINFRDSMKIWRKGAGSLADDLGIEGKGATTGGSQALRTTDDDLLLEYCVQDCRIIVKAMQMYFKLVVEYGGPIDGYLTAGSTAIELGKIWLENKMLAEAGSGFDGMTEGDVYRNINEMFPSDIDAIDSYTVDVKDGKRVEEVVDGVKRVKCTYKPIVKKVIKRDSEGKPVRDENGKVVKEDKVVHPDGKSKYGMFFRKGFKGAIPLLNRMETLGKGYVAKHVRSLDINSAYPDVVVNYPLPVGKPIEYYKGNSIKDILEVGVVPKGYTYYVSVEVDMHVKKGKRATYIDKSGTGENDDGSDCKLVDSFCGVINVCQPEWEMICHDYDFACMPVIKKAVMFKTMTGVFSGFITEFYNKKAKSKGALREFCKLIVNSFYGKFGTNPFSEEEAWVIRDGIARKFYVRGGSDIDCDFYLPYAIWITGYVRQKISMSCDTIGWDNVIYTDTDSLKIQGGMSVEECRDRLSKAKTEYAPKGYIIDKYILGAFKDEGVHDKIAFIRNKGYVCMNMDDTISVNEYGDKEITMGGVNKFQGLNCLRDLLEGRGHQNGHFSVVGGGLIMAKPIKLAEMSQFTEKLIYIKKEI